LAAVQEFEGGGIAVEDGEEIGAHLDYHAGGELLLVFDLQEGAVTASQISQIIEIVVISQLSMIHFHTFLSHNYRYLMH
jgi:hypothetical protein